MNSSKKIWKLKNKINSLLSDKHKYEIKNKILIRENYDMEEKIKSLEKKNNYFYKNIKNLIKDQKKYFRLIGRFQLLQNDFINLSNFVSKNKSNPENFKNLKECKICCNYIINEPFIICPNKNCNTYMHKRCLNKTKFKGNKCIYCFQNLE